jgi:PAS domain S-box-containing protein
VSTSGNVKELFKDLTEREIRHRWHTEVLELIAAYSPIAIVMERITLAMEDLVKDSIASVVLLDENRCVRHAAAPHLPEEFIQAVDGLEIGPVTGSCGTAMYRGERVIVSDIENDPLWEPYRTLALGCGLRACWSTPVKGADGRVLASFALYYRQSRTPTAEELLRVDDFAKLVSVALDHTRTMDSLKASEEKFRQFAENIDQVFWMRDPKVGKMFYINPAYESIWGKSCQSLYENPKQWIESIHPDDRDYLLEKVAKHSDSSYEVEYRIIRPDGETRWILDRGFPVVVQDGTVTCIVGIAADVTRQKQYERELRQSERRFQAISDATSDVQWDWNIVSDTIWWSEDLQTLIGYAPHEVANSAAWLALIHPDDREQVAKDNFGAIDRGDEYWEAEYRLLHRDGRIIEVEDRGCTIIDEAGRPIRLVGGISDVTARNRSRNDLRERIKELRCLYEVLRLTQDQDKSIEDICTGIARILPNSLLHSDVAVARVVLENNEYSTEHWRQPRSRFSFDIMVENARVGFVEVGYTEEQENAEVSNNPFLDEEVEMVKAVATHVGRMLESRRLASRITRIERLKAIGELTGGIAHDFNNLLTVILGNAELMAKILPEEHRVARLAKMTATAALRGADLTNHLLAFARRQALSPSATDVGALMRGMRPLLGRTLGEHIKLKVSCDDTAWPAMVDPSQLESAVLNLCINARDAMPNGGRLTIEVINVDLDATYVESQDELITGAYVMVAVSDTGVGMTPEVLESAFEPFFTTKEVGEGSGLGLSMVYGFAKQSRGHVRMYSEPGHGASVKLYLPRAEESAESLRESEEDTELPRGSEHVLLVEDNELVRLHVADQLHELGYRVTLANNGAEALEILRTHNHFDLLFTDVVMPGGLNGPDLAREAHKLNPNLPVLFTSGYTDGSINHGSRPDPAFPILTKPYRNRDLALRIRQALVAHKTD